MAMRTMTKSRMFHPEEKYALTPRPRSLRTASRANMTVKNIVRPFRTRCSTWNLRTLASSRASMMLLQTMRRRMNLEK